MFTDNYHWATFWLLNLPSPASFSFIFGLFQTNMFLKHCFLLFVKFEDKVSNAKVLLSSKVGGDYVVSSPLNQLKMLNY